MSDFDVLIRNGRVIDGAGNPWFRGDVGVSGEKIAAVGDLSGSSATREIDAAGRLVCPGFVDVHSHSDTSFLVNPRAESKITQAVTTEICGNCGYSTWLSAALRDEPGASWDWKDLPGYFAALEAKGMPVNLGTLVGHGAVRSRVMGAEGRAPTTDELDAMREIVDQAMRDGAFGLSTGLKYAPGCYADIDEVAALAEAAGRRGGLYCTHLRNQGAALIESIDEAVEIGRRGGCPVHIAHLKVKGRENWGKARHMLAVIDAARADGMDVTFDQYPYPAASCAAMAITPAWAREGGPGAFLERLRDPEQRPRIEAGVVEQEDWTGSQRILISNCPPDTSVEGKSLAELAEAAGKSREAVMCDLLDLAGERLRVVFFFGWEEDIRAIMAHPAMMVGSDGSSLSREGKLGEGKPHPRNYGAFPRFLSRYVLKERLLSVEEGVRRMTSFPAARFALFDRGLLRPGAWADIVVADPDRLADTATYEDPHQVAVGIAYVLVNGRVIVEGERFNGRLAGKVLRKGNAGVCLP